MQYLVYSIPYTARFLALNYNLCIWARNGRSERTCWLGPWAMQCDLQHSVANLIFAKNYLSCTASCSIDEH